MLCICFRHLWFAFTVSWHSFSSLSPIHMYEGRCSPILGMSKRIRKNKPFSEAYLHACAMICSVPLVFRRTTQTFRMVDADVVSLNKLVVEPTLH